MAVVTALLREPQNRLFQPSDHTLGITCSCGQWRLSSPMVPDAHNYLGMAWEEHTEIDCTLVGGYKLNGLWLL